ncbi:hypothetical protein ACG02S_01975 [Roseateles sp. DC23W]|uniref:Tetratricopeptide repeat-containing protein n=1 Tax=Pelomonas dachongensis TaxID=3299029 RepID=A0ABW7EJ01_9BURK
MRFSAPDPQAHAIGMAALRDQLQQAVQAGDTLAIVDHAADLAGMLTTARQEREALDLLRRHADAAGALPHAEPAGWYWSAYATALQYTGQRLEADRYFAEALALSVAATWTRLQAMVLHHWGRNLAEQRRFAEAEARITEALALRVQMNHPLQQSSRLALERLTALRGDAA